MKLSEYSTLITGWAADRNLIEGSGPTQQFDKLFEENGENAGHSARGKLELVPDDLGDIFVVITILAAQIGVSVPLAKAETYTENDTLCSTPRLSMYVELGHLVLLVDKQGDKNDTQFCLSEIAYLLRRQAEDLGTTLEACVDIAWNDIKDRKGKMINGVFVKEADL